jgi:hypothetical protein
MDSKEVSLVAGIPPTLFLFSVVVSYHGLKDRHAGFTVSYNI